jgi:hypothetical protein
VVQRLTIRHRPRVAFPRNRSAEPARWPAPIWVAVPPRHGEHLSDANRSFLGDNDHQSRKGRIVARRSSFPPAGFLILGVFSIATSILFVVRSVAVAATAERVWSAVVFGAFGIFWLAAYRSTYRQSAK